MSEYEKLKQLLDKLYISYTEKRHTVYVKEIRLTTAPVSIIWWGQDEFTIVGAGYNNVWEYSPEYIARMLDRKFRDGEL